MLEILPIDMRDDVTSEMVRSNCQLAHDGDCLDVVTDRRFLVSMLHFSVA